VTVLRDDFAWEAYRLHFARERLARLGNLGTPKKAVDAIKGTTLNLGDVIIAAVAIHYEVTLLTGNVKDFPMKELSLEPLPNP
jgi:predicted nucleic acid-binding protein